MTILYTSPAIMHISPHRCGYTGSENITHIKLTYHPRRRRRMLWNLLYALIMHERDMITRDVLATSIVYYGKGRVIYVIMRDRCLCSLSITGWVFKTTLEDFSIDFYDMCL